MGIPPSLISLNEVQLSEWLVEDGGGSSAVASAAFLSGLSAQTLHQYAVGLCLCYIRQGGT